MAQQVERGTCHQTWQSGSSSCDPHDWRREPTPKSFPLTSTLVRWLMCMFTCLHMQFMYTHTSHNCTRTHKHSNHVLKTRKADIPTTHVAIPTHLHAHPLSHSLVYLPFTHVETVEHPLTLLQGLPRPWVFQCLQVTSPYIGPCSKAKPRPL